MNFKLSREKYEVLDSFQDYIAKGGSIVTFAEYFLFKNESEDDSEARALVILALCEELVLTRQQDRMYEVLNAIFTIERWKLDDFKQFLKYIEESETLSSYHQSIFALYENCKNYIKSC